MLQLHALLMLHLAHFPGPARPTQRLFCAARNWPAALIQASQRGGTFSLTMGVVRGFWLRVVAHLQPDGNFREK